MPRSRAGLPDLVHVRKAAQNCFAFSALVHQALAAAERSLRPTQESEYQLLRLSSMHRAIALLLRPPRTTTEHPWRPADRLLMPPHPVAGDRSPRGRAGTATCSTTRPPGAPAHGGTPRRLAAPPMDAASASARPPCAADRSPARQRRRAVGHGQASRSRAYPAAQPKRPSGQRRATVELPAAITIWQADAATASRTAAYRVNELSERDARDGQERTARPRSGPPRPATRRPPSTVTRRPIRPPRPSSNAALPSDPSASV